MKMQTIPFNFFSARGRWYRSGRNVPTEQEDAHFKMLVLAMVLVVFTTGTTVAHYRQFHFLKVRVLNRDGTRHICIQRHNHRLAWLGSTEPELSGSVPDPDRGLDGIKRILGTGFFGFSHFFSSENHITGTVSPRGKNRKKNPSHLRDRFTAW